MRSFKSYTRKDLLSLVRLRRFETKLGERVQCIQEDTLKDIEKSNAKYILLGISEDIGVKANFGVGGTRNAWQNFLPAFLNIQSNAFLEGGEILVAGYFDFSQLDDSIASNAKNEEEKLEALRKAVNLIDDEVAELIKHITKSNKIPVIIGGGHNNAYPCIRGAAKGWQKAGITKQAKINAVNFDAHTDFRTTEGRHSGNGFSYAFHETFLSKYAMVGVHENYVTQNMLLDIENNENLLMFTYEEMFLYGSLSFGEALKKSADFTSDTICGIELDVDAIINALSSAQTPSGFQVLHARQYVSNMAHLCNVAYLHIAEAASKLDTGMESPYMAKLLTYLVSDFIKAHNQKNA